MVKHLSRTIYLVISSIFLLTLSVVGAALGIWITLNCKSSGVCSELRFYAILLVVGTLVLALVNVMVVFLVSCCTPILYNMTLTDSEVVHPYRVRRYRCFRWGVVIGNVLFLSGLICVLLGGLLLALSEHYCAGGVMNGVLGCSGSMGAITALAMGGAAMFLGLVACTPMLVPLGAFICCLGLPIGGMS